MPMMFFHFLKIIFDISTSKRSKKYKPRSILAKKKFQNLMKRNYKRNIKRCLSVLASRLSILFSVSFIVLFNRKYFKMLFSYIGLSKL